MSDCFATSKSSTKYFYIAGVAFLVGYVIILSLIGQTVEFYFDHSLVCVLKSITV